jgi:hypothetical protein
MRTFRPLLVLMSCITAIAFSSDAEEAPGYRATYPDQVIEIDQLSICPAHCRKGHFSYGETNANIDTLAYSKGSVENSVIAGLRNVHISLGSKIKPQDTLYGVIGVQSTYTGVEAWKWIANGIIEPNLKSTNLIRKTRYIASLDGRYEAAPSTGIHVGMYAEIGLRSSIVHPLIGIDYTLGPWLIQGVYPIKYGITYQGLEKHRFSLMVRPFYTAVHVQKGLHDRSATVRYKGTGAELRWDYLPAQRWNWWLSVGYTVEGNLTIGDSNNNHRHHINLHNAPYFNIGVTFGI